MLVHANAFSPGVLGQGVVKAAQYPQLELARGSLFHCRVFKPCPILPARHLFDMPGGGVRVLFRGRFALSAQLGGM